MRIPLTVEGSQQLNFTQKTPQTLSGSLKTPAFEAVQCFSYLFVESKSAKKIKVKKHGCVLRINSDLRSLA